MCGARPLYPLPLLSHYTHLLFMSFTTNWRSLLSLSLWPTILHALVPRHTMLCIFPPSTPLNLFMHAVTWPDNRLKDSGGKALFFFNIMCVCVCARARGSRTWKPACYKVCGCTTPQYSSHSCCTAHTPSNIHDLSPATREIHRCPTTHPRGYPAGLTAPPTTAVPLATPPPPSLVSVLYPCCCPATHSPAHLSSPLFLAA